MYNLITYEMACTVNALKLQWETFFFIWKNTVSWRNYIFALLIQFFDFPIGMLFCVQICKWNERHSQNKLNVKSNNKTNEWAISVVALCACVCHLPWQWLYSRLNELKCNHCKDIEGKVPFYSVRSKEGWVWKILFISSAWTWKMSLSKDGIQY